MRQHLKPKLVRVIDKRGDELLPRAKQVIEGDRAAIKADQDWQESRIGLDAEIPAMRNYSSRPKGAVAAFIAGFREGLDAEIPAMPDSSTNPFGRIAAVIFLLIAAFIAGLAVGRMA